MITRTLRVPADIAISRVEALLADTSGEPWAEAEMLQQLACLYAYAGRFAEARAARVRGRAMLADFGARHTLAVTCIHSATVELTAGDPVAAERALRQGRTILGATGDRRYASMITSLLAEALYAQNRIGEALQMADDTSRLAHADDAEPQARYRAVKAKALACRGRFQAATTLCDDAASRASATSKSALQAEMLLAKAEVSRLAGAHSVTRDSLQQALHIYEQKHAKPLADRVRQMLQEIREPI